MNDEFVIGRLGKQEYKFDQKTLKLGRAISPQVVYPHTYDLDKGRKAFPLELWGNDAWGDCVKVAEANEVIRLERLEQRKTLPITAEIVVDAYKKQTGAQSPDDNNDTGLVMLDNNVLWRNEGFTVGSRAYKIAAFGEIDPTDEKQVRAAIYLLHGIQLGFALPLTARSQTSTGKWDYIPGDNSPEARPGSWGGHAVFSKKYDEGGIEVLTWGRKVYVTNSFIARYCDEAWAVVDSFDAWRRRPEIDIQTIIQHLRDIGARGIQ